MARRVILRRRNNHRRRRGADFAFDDLDQLSGMLSGRSRHCGIFARDGFVEDDPLRHLDCQICCEAQGNTLS